MTNNCKLEIQNIIEKILQKHNIDPSGDYFLKLRLTNYDDLIIEKMGEHIRIGNYYIHPSGDYISDPVFAFEYHQGYWFPVRIELLFGHKFCRISHDGILMIYPEIIKVFILFQRMFAKNIEDQKFLEIGEEVDD
ncbi:MAG TPA: hypothetical protein VF354_04365 [Candidatus Methanoperedens sp.]